MSTGERPRQHDLVGKVDAWVHDYGVRSATLLYIGMGGSYLDTRNLISISSGVRVEVPQFQYTYPGVRCAL